MNASSKWLASWMLASGVAGLSSAARAQQAPAAPPADLTSSGSLLRNNPNLNVPDAPRADDEAAGGGAPAMPGADNAAMQGPAFAVSRIDVEGVPEAARKKVDAIVDAYKGQQLTLGQLREIAARITQALAEQGESISYASIPPQKIKDGVVRLQIIQGRLESLTLGQNQSLVADKVLQAYLRRAQRYTGNITALQDQLLLISDLPGVGSASPVLAAGETPGGTAMTVDAGPASRADVLVMADNAGSTTSGRNRVGLQVSANSPLGLGDRFQAIGYVSPGFAQFNHDSDFGNTTIGRVSYDLPVNAMGTRVGAAVSRVDYALGGRYHDKGRGHANVFSLYANHPLVRSRTRNLNLSVTLDQKEMRDTLIGDTNKRSAQVLGVQLSGDWRASLGGMPTVMQYQAGVNHGRLHNPDTFYGSRTNGRFLKTTQGLKVLQGIRPGVYVDLTANAQQTSRNLDGAEKMILGGPSAVRAYSNDTVSADSGVVASATLNVAVPQVKGLTLQAFYDIAQAKVQKFNKNSTHVEMSGYGVGASYTVNKRAIINVSIARPNGHTNLGQRPSGQIWVSTAIRF